MKAIIKKNGILILFIFLFLFGLSNIGGYGRPIDEPPEQEILLMNIKEYSSIAGIDLDSSLFNGIDRISESIEQDHGIAAYYLFMPLFVLTGRETLSSMAAWHIYTYLIWFLGVVALYHILKEIHHSHWTPVAGVLMYYFTPRMYAESHYNNKDIILLSLVFLILMFAVRTLKRWHTKDIIGFGIASGFLMNCKIIGIAIWGLTGLFAIAHVLIFVDTKKRKRAFSDLILAAILSLIVFFLLTPAMWRFPVSYIQYCLTNATGFSRWGKSFLFYGRTVTPIATGVPRTYVLQWMLLTTPVYVTVLFISSIILFGWKVRDCKELQIDSSGVDRKWLFLLFIATFIFPVSVSIIKAPSLVLYNGWRHNYYLYAYVVLCASYSIDWILEKIKARKARVLSVPTVLLGIMALGFMLTFSDMMLHRSYEYMYFNPLARTVEDVEGFEGDYWNVAELPAMKAFSKEFEEEIRIAPIGYAADGQFKDAKIGNLHIVTETDNPDYYLFNTCMIIDKDVLEGYEKVYSFEKYGRELCAIFEKK